MKANDDPYHQTLLSRLRRVRCIRRDSFNTDQIDLWKRAVDLESWIDRVLTTHCNR